MTKEQKRRSDSRTLVKSAFNVSLTKTDRDIILNSLPDYFSTDLDSGIDVHAILATKLGTDRETAKRKLYYFLYSSKSVASLLWIQQESRAFYLLATKVAKEKGVPSKSILDEYNKLAAEKLGMPARFQ